MISDKIQTRRRSEEDSRFQWRTMIAKHYIKEILKNRGLENNNLKFVLL